MITQKLYKSGNSVALTIPKEYLNDLHLSEDSEVVVKKQGKKITVTPKNQELAREGVDAKFMKMVDEFIQDHEDVLKELAKK